MAQKFAVFDIDGTVIRWQLYHAIATQLSHQDKLLPGAEERIRLARQIWKIRSHQESFREYEMTLVRTFQEASGNITLLDMERAAQAVFDEHKDQVYTFSRDLIRSLKADGYLLLAISGSPVHILKKLAGYYGFDDFLGTTFAEKNGVLGKETYAPVHDKATALKQLVAKHKLSFKDSVAIGDSKSDAAMLELVEKPIAFNPEKALFDIAKESGWRIVVERKNVIYTLEQKDGTYLLV